MRAPLVLSKFAEAAEFDTQYTGPSAALAFVAGGRFSSVAWQPDSEHEGLRDDFSTHQRDTIATHDVAHIRVDVIPAPEGVSLWV
jgi:hypothetical protein